jgi:hypothetical protein
MPIGSSDAHYVIGKSHAVCQDYAAAWTSGGVRFAAVADGCSSAPNSDLGARALVLLAKTNCHASFEKIQERILDDIPCIPGTSLENYRATLGFLKATEERVDVALWGDGVVFARRLDGTFDVTSVSYTEGAPPYLSYLRFYKDVEAYNRLSKNGHHVVRRWERDLPLPDQEAENPELSPHLFTFHPKDYDLIAVCSDGIESFTGEGAPKTALDSVKLVGAITALSPGFVLRRLQNGLPRYCTTNRVVHHDDISMGAVSFGG